MKLILSFIAFICAVCVLSQVKSDKYPDIIAETYVSNYFETRGVLYGGRGLDYPIQMDAEKILGKNTKKWFVSLPIDSYIILQYTDNEIVNAPNQNDIIVVEHGCCHEFAAIYVSHDGKHFTYLGTVDDCDNNELDLAAIDYKKSVRYIKVVGLDAKCASPGFDLVSVYGLPGANKNLFVGIDDVTTYFEDKKSDKILILENIYFDTDVSTLKENEVNDLDKVVEQLLTHSDIRISINGHTDDRASERYNLLLSKRRAETVKKYLVKNGIDINRIEVHGFGESQPLSSNNTARGRAINRRVELRRLN